MKTAGIKAAKEAIDHAATPANTGAIKIRTAMWERNARPMSDKPVTMPAAINIVATPNLAVALSSKRLVRFNDTPQQPI